MSVSRRFTGLCLTLMLATSPILIAAAPHTSSIEVTMSGEVLQPGTYQLQPGARLSDASAAGLVSARAWPLGAALLRQQAIEPQQRLKAGILFELQALRVHALAAANADLLLLLEPLYAMIDAMPITGRIPMELDPLQQLIPRNNALLESGDHLIYPLRPAHVRVLGALAQDCPPVFRTDAAPADYLRQCERHRVADRSFVHLIQPDGTWRKVGVAGWNVEPANVAAGAIIFVPLNSNLLDYDTAELNGDLAAFLATQYQLGGLFSE